MPPLADVQAGVARAVVMGDAEPIAALLAGGADPRARFAIHQRHYAASLAAALRQKFPATAWLVGEDAVLDAARAYARAHPPRRPCIADYGEHFPAFLADRLPALPYLGAFMELEWSVGQVSITVGRPPLAWPQLARRGSESLPDAGLTMQPGLRYLRLAWNLDELMTMYLSGAVADKFVLRKENACIEVRGGRGALWIDRIDPATFVFRSALSAGASIGEAASAALDGDATFDAGNALRAIVTDGLATDLSAPAKEPIS
jgi:hypothetical protein